MKRCIAVRAEFAVPRDVIEQTQIILVIALQPAVLKNRCVLEGQVMLFFFNLGFNLRIVSKVSAY
jgi:hypothetical protein